MRAACPRVRCRRLGGQSGIAGISPVGAVRPADQRGLTHGRHRQSVALRGRAALQDRATFFDPHRYPSGVVYVVIGGLRVVDGGDPAWTLSGTVLHRDDT